MTTIRGLLISLLLFTAVLTGVGIFMSNLIGENVQNITTVNRINSEVKTLEESVRGSQVTGLAFVDVPLMIVSGIFNALKLAIVSVTSLWIDFIHGIKTYLFLPDWFTQIIIAIISIVVLFEIISAIVKYRL